MFNDDLYRAVADMTDVLHGRAVDYETRAAVERDFAEPEPARWVGADGNEYALYEDGDGPEMVGEHDHAGHDAAADDDHEPALSGRVFEDDDGRRYEPSLEEASLLVAAATERWGDLTAADRELVTEIAHEVQAARQEQDELAHGVEVMEGIVGDLREQGYDMDGHDGQEFARLLNDTGNLDHALAGLHAIGPTPRDLDAALTQAVRYSREGREAEHYHDRDAS
jgi:hypothetical protein